MTGAREAAAAFLADGDSDALLERRLADEGFETKVVSRYDEVAELALLLEPQAVVITCPRAITGKTCEEIRDSIIALLGGGEMPLLITRVNTKAAWRKSKSGQSCA